MKPPSQEAMLVAAHECLADLPARELAKKLVEAQATCLEFERKMDERTDQIVDMRRMIDAAEAILRTVVQGIGCRDLLDLCAVTRSEILRLQGKADEVKF